MFGSCSMHLIKAPMQLFEKVVINENKMYIVFLGII
jgi:hypothetical protein